MVTCLSEHNTVHVGLGVVIVNSYRFYFKDRDHVTVGGGVFDAEDLDAAIRIVRVRCAAWPDSCHSYELTQDDRVVHAEIMILPGNIGGN